MPLNRRADAGGLDEVDPDADIHFASRAALAGHSSRDDARETIEWPSSAPRSGIISPSRTFVCDAVAAFTCIESCARSLLGGAFKSKTRLVQTHSKSCP